MKNHNYKVSVVWTGNEGTGTSNYQSYRRGHRISAEGKYMSIDGSSDPSFRGDKTKYNPEDLFLSSIAACHMLWYLHVCASNNVIVIDYQDTAQGIMQESADGSGQFEYVTLNPVVKVTESHMVAKAEALHAEANKMCFIANSCNFKIGHKPTILVGQ